MRWVLTLSCWQTLQVTEFLDVSMELGCFLAGALLSTQGHMVTTEVMGCIEPIRDFLAIIFFASIGQTRDADRLLLSALLKHCTFLQQDLTDLVCLCRWRSPRVPNICAVWTYHSAGANTDSRYHEGTALFYRFYRSLLLALSSVIISSYSLPVHDGCAGAFSAFASGFPTYTLGCFSWSGSGQRILLRFKQPSTARWHHLQRGQWQFVSTACLKT